MNTQVQRNRKYLQFAFRSDRAQKAELVFDMFDDIEDENQSEEGGFLLTVSAVLLMQELEHLACATWYP